MFRKNRNIEIEYCTPRVHTGNGVVERAIQTLKILIIANLEDGISLTESVNRALHVMRFTIHTGLKLTPFELHHGRKRKTELTNIVKDGKTEEKHLAERPKSPKKKNSVRYPFYFVEKNHNKKSLEGKFQKKYKPL